ncbi:UNVERIFIED_ORG: hypothetical protein J2W85_001387 [Ensifer adhaerens]|nr:hypothetical protein [Ensifer adhaerens]
MAMLGHLLKLILGPCRDSVDVAVLIPHEIEIGKGNRDRLGAYAEEAADVNDNAAAGARSMHMINFADFMVIRSVNCRTFQDCGREFCRCEADVISVIHLRFSFEMNW